MKTYQCLVCGFIHDEGPGCRKKASLPAPAGTTSRPTGRARTAAWPRPISKLWKSRMTAPLPLVTVCAGMSPTGRANSAILTTPDRRCPPLRRCSPLIRAEAYVVQGTPGRNGSELPEGPTSGPAHTLRCGARGRCQNTLAKGSDEMA